MTIKKNIFEFLDPSVVIYGTLFIVFLIGFLLGINLIPPQESTDEVLDKVKVMCIKDFLNEKPPTWEFKYIKLVDCEELMTKQNVSKQK